ncbi:MAG: hypothetical protein H6627_11650 [Calditrichae bacterium]|nr:hypothetical protein [Calditrichota bacterium]MCB9059213.1 hypothetical protein [Calditrichia bacterium]
MGPIKQLFSTSPDLKKTDTNKKLNKSNESASNKDQNSASVKSTQKDQVQISSKGRELLTLKIEAESYLKDIKESETVSPQELDAIKEKIASKYYFEKEVIDDLVDRLMNLPNYMDLR